MKGNPGFQRKSNQNKIGRNDSPFRTSHKYNFQTGNPTTNFVAANGGPPKVACCNMLGEQLQYSNPVNGAGCAYTVASARALQFRF